jgi:hypothetical protein
MRLLSALTALLFVGGIVGLATVDSDDDGEDAALTTVTSPTTSSTLATTSSSSVGAASVTTVVPVTTTVAGSGLGTSGSATVSGSGQMAETGAESLLWPGLGLLGLGLAGRRLPR